MEMLEIGSHGGLSRRPRFLSTQGRLTYILCPFKSSRPRCNSIKDAYARVMNLEDVFNLVERLRKQAANRLLAYWHIGEPKWIADKQVFEYQDRSARVVAVLKLTRAAHGVSA